MIVDQMIVQIRETGALRTPGLSMAFSMVEARVDQVLAPLCAPGGPLVSCDVEVAGRRVKEYRCSTIGGGKLTDTWTVGRPRTKPEAKPDPAFGHRGAIRDELAARFSRPADPHLNHVPPTAAKAAPKPAQEAVAPMSTTNRIIEAIRKHGPMTIATLRDHVKHPNVATLCAQAARKGKLVKLGGGYRAAVYGVEGQKLPAGAEQSPPPAKKKRKAKEARKGAGGGRSTKAGKVRVKASKQVVVRGVGTLAFSEKRLHELLVAALHGKAFELTSAEARDMAAILTMEPA